MERKADGWPVLSCSALCIIISRAHSENGKLYVQVARQVRVVFYTSLILSSQAVFFPQVQVRKNLEHLECRMQPRVPGQASPPPFSGDGPARVIASQASHHTTEPSPITLQALKHYTCLTLDIFGRGVAAPTPGAHLQATHLFVSYCPCSICLWPARGGVRSSSRLRPAWLSAQERKAVERPGCACGTSGRCGVGAVGAGVACAVWHIAGIRYA